MFGDPIASIFGVIIIAPFVYIWQSKKGWRLATFHTIAWGLSAFCINLIVTGAVLYFLGR